ncbi:MAG: hypothetical protein ABI383_08265 [Acidobacteriaceae bacterium]
MMETVVRPIKVFDDWKPGLKPIATLRAGEHVTLAGGVNIVKRPDDLVTLVPIPQLHVDQGVHMLRYISFGEGEAQLWVQGCWYPDIDATVRNADGSGYQNHYKAQEIQHGIQIWWFHIRLPDGTMAWVNGGLSCATR